jgi:hypothetical protein
MESAGDKHTNAVKKMAKAHKEAGFTMQDAWKMVTEFVTKIAESSERQIIGMANAIAESMKAVSSQISGTANLMLELMKNEPKSAGQAAAASEMKRKLIEQFDLQNRLGNQQILLNEANLENLKMKNAMMKAGTPITHKIDVQGVPAEHIELIKSVMDGIFVKAKQEGGDLCIG